MGTGDLDEAEGRDNTDLLNPLRCSFLVLKKLNKWATPGTISNRSIP